KVLQARQKGITDSLVVTKNAALVVSAKNNTVVTAMDRKEASTHIFTNINGTILMDEF
ncbi:MAG TPA: flagellar protein, partial [Bacillales bacterium]|nr:flagellar protein [Bacillales bacterium]